MSVQGSPNEMAPVLTLTDAERAALAKELRSYAEHRQGYSVYDPSETYAELANDPTYAYEPIKVWDQVTAREERQHQAVQESNGAAAATFNGLARQVEEHGSLTLTRDTAHLLDEVFSNAGWGDSLHGDSPPELKRAVDAVHTMKSRSAGHIAVPRWVATANPTAAPVWETVTAPAHTPTQIDRDATPPRRHNLARPAP